VDERLPLADRIADLASLGASELQLTQIDVRAEGNPSPEANRWSDRDGLETLWLGPDQTLVTGPIERRAELLRQLRASLDERHTSVVDVSSMRAIIELPDAVADDVLPAGCGLDLDRSVWRTGMCAQTLLARVPVLLQRRERGSRVFVRASFSEWLLDWLLAVRV
jgi:sarcosine oxidase, subunit gamma